MEVWELREGFALEHLRKTERPDPVAGPGEVLLAMRAASLNYRDTVAVLSDGVGEVVAVGGGGARCASAT